MGQSQQPVSLLKSLCWENLDNRPLSSNKVLLLFFLRFYLGVGEWEEVDGEEVGSPRSREPHAGLHPRTPRIMTSTEGSHSTSVATQTPILILLMGIVSHDRFGQTSLSRGILTLEKN